ncbi:hypothetical protein ACJX0J_018618, partial [Zea mays]
MILLNDTTDWSEGNTKIVHKNVIEKVPSKNWYFNLEAIMHLTHIIMHGSLIHFLKNIEYLNLNRYIINYIFIICYLVGPSSNVFQGLDAKDVGCTRFLQLVARAKDGLRDVTDRSGNILPGYRYLICIVASFLIGYNDPGFRPCFFSCHSFFLKCFLFIFAYFLVFIDHDFSLIDHVFFSVPTFSLLVLLTPPDQPLLSLYIVLIFWLNVHFFPNHSIRDQLLISNKIYKLSNTSDHHFSSSHVLLEDIRYLELPGGGATGGVALFIRQLKQLVWLEELVVLGMLSCCTNIWNEYHNDIACCGILAYSMTEKTHFITKIVIYLDTNKETHSSPLRQIWIYITKV